MCNKVFTCAFILFRSDNIPQVCTLTWIWIFSDSGSRFISVFHLKIYYASVIILFISSRFNLNIYTHIHICRIIHSNFQGFKWRNMIHLSFCSPSEGPWGQPWTCQEKLCWARGAGHVRRTVETPSSTVSKNMKEKNVIIVSLPFTWPGWYQVSVGNQLTRNILFEMGEARAESPKSKPTNQESGPSCCWDGAEHCSTATPFFFSRTHLPFTRHYEASNSNIPAQISWCSQLSYQCSGDRPVPGISSPTDPTASQFCFVGWCADDETAGRN